MKKFCLVLCSVLFLGLVYPCHAKNENRKFKKNQNPVKQSYIVVLEDTLDSDLSSVVDELSRQYKANIRKGGPRKDGIMRHAIQGFSAVMKEQDAVELSNDPRVRLVEEDAYIQFSGTRTFTTSDPHYNLDRIDQVESLNVSPELAYTYESTGAGVTVYVLDSGVERNHIEFDDDGDQYTSQANPRVRDGVSFASDGFPAWQPCGPNLPTTYVAGTHGTAVASVIGGNTVGVANQVIIQPVKIANCDGSGTLV